MKNTQVFEHNRDHKKREREREIHVVDGNDDNDNDEWKGRGVKGAILACLDGKCLEDYNV